MAVHPSESSSPAENVNTTPGCHAGSESASSPPLSDREYTVQLTRMARLVRMGANALKRAALADAIAYFEQAHQIAVQSKLGPDAEVGTLRNLAMAKREAGDEEGALQAYQQALDVPEISDAHKAAILHGMGLLCYQIGETEKARHRLKEAYQVYQRLATPNDQIQAAVLLSRIERELNRCEEAERIIQEVLDSLSTVDPSDIPYVLLEAAQVALSREDYEQCHHFLARISENLPKEDPNLLTEYYVIQTRFFYLTGRSDAALSACGQAMDLAIQHRRWIDLRQTHQLLRKLVQGN